MNNLHELFIMELQDLYDSEDQIIKALPKMIDAAESANLKSAFEDHLRETIAQKERLGRVLDLMDEKPKGSCVAMKGIIKEGEDIIKTKGDPAVKDAALIAAAQKVEHYEIASYGSVVSFAELMEHNEALAMLQETLAEEEATDTRLTRLAEDEINTQALDTT